MCFIFATRFYLGYSQKKQLNTHQKEQLNNLQLKNL